MCNYSGEGNGLRKIDCKEGAKNCQGFNICPGIHYIVILEDKLAKTEKERYETMREAFFLLISQSNNFFKFALWVYAWTLQLHQRAARNDMKNILVIIPTMTFIKKIQMHV